MGMSCGVGNLIEPVVFTTVPVHSQIPNAGLTQPHVNGHVKAEPYATQPEHHPPATGDQLPSPAKTGPAGSEPSEPYRGVPSQPYVSTPEKPPPAQSRRAEPSRTVDAGVGHPVPWSPEGALPSKQVVGTVAMSQLPNGVTVTVSGEQSSPGKYAWRFSFSSPAKPSGGVARVLIAPNEIMHLSGPQGEHVMVVPVAQVQAPVPMCAHVVPRGLPVVRYAYD